VIYCGLGVRRVSLLACSAFSVTFAAIDALRQQIFFRSSTAGIIDFCFNVAFFFLNTVVLVLALVIGLGLCLSTEVKYLV